MPFNKKKPLKKINKVNVELNKASKAILPDGTAVTREEILKQLNLDPSVAADSWLNVIACGSNATALRPADAIELLDKDIIKKDMLHKDQLEAIRKIR